MIGAVIAYFGVPGRSAGPATISGALAAGMLYGYHGQPPAWHGYRALGGLVSIVVAWPVSYRTASTRLLRTYRAEPAA